mgnify:FL=1
MAYFTKYPKIRYPFGGQSTTAVTQDIGVYIDLIDRIKDDASYYKEYPIRAGDRPDTVSQALYGTPDYYWTFFLLNDDLKLRGWPLSDQAITQKAKEEYPNKVLVTREDMTGRFQVGDTIRGLNSGAHGKVIRRRPDMGQIIVQPIPNPNPGPNESATAIIPFENDEDAESIRVVQDADGEFIGAPSMRIDRVVDEFNAKHHYENANGEPVDIFPRAPYVQRFHIDATYSPTNYYYINPTADITSGDLTSIAIYFNPSAAASATNPVPNATTIAGIVAAESALLVPTFLAQGYSQAAAEAAALATSATSLSPLKNFEVNTTTYQITDTTGDGISTGGAWMFDFDEPVTLSTFDNLDKELTLSEANTVSLLGNLLPGANILRLLFTALQVINQKKETGLPLSLAEFNILFTTVLRQTNVDTAYTTAVLTAFTNIITANLGAYLASGGAYITTDLATATASDIKSSRIAIEFDYFFLVDKLIDVAGGGNTTDTIGTLMKYTVPDYTKVAAGTAAVPETKTFYKTLYSSTTLNSGSTTTVKVLNATGAATPATILTAFGGTGTDTVTITDFTSKDDAYDELKRRFDEYITVNYDGLEPAILTPKTFLERYIEQNNTLKNIKVLRPENIQSFDEQFRRILGEAVAEEVVVNPVSQGSSLYTSTPQASSSNTATSTTSTSASTSTSSSSGSSGY